MQQGSWKTLYEHRAGSAHMSQGGASEMLIFTNCQLIEPVKVHPIQSYTFSKDQSFTVNNCLTTYTHWTKFLDLFWISWIPSNTLVISYTLLFLTPNSLATSFSSKTPSGADLRISINLRVRWNSDTSNRGRGKFKDSVKQKSGGNIREDFTSRLQTGIEVHGTRQLRCYPKTKAWTLNFTQWTILARCYIFIIHWLFRALVGNYSLTS